ncbi:hypothetical protein JK358_07805 [Nocardia sp. 2]|uniref:AMIN-like domain-containing protein n=1 Tax=Nocardia acididurans TaxID=2802282 RepID=A0ABS1M259_9NOCA|nr:hypothetical protein [Nocardia acididurans]
MLVALSALVLTLLIPVGQASATPYCGIVWGSLERSNPTHGTSPLTNIRSGRHDCFDRMVLDIAGPATGYLATYVDQVHMDASGAPVPLRGSAFLQVVVHAPAYDTNGNSTYTPANFNELTNVTGYDTFRQIAWAGSFEGQTTIGLGVRARLPFRVFTLDGPNNGSRVVVDVAHRW